MDGIVRPVSVINRYDVVVVGGAVVGAALTLALHKAGFKVALVERGPPPKPFDAHAYDPRVYALAPAGIRFLDSLGVWKAIVDRRVSAYRGMEIWENDPQHALRFNAAESGVGELGSIVENSLLLSELWSALQSVPIQAGQTVEGCDLDTSPASLRLSDGMALHAGLVISAEGAESTLREAAGLETTAWSYEQRAVVCHVRTEKSHAGTAYQRFLPTGPLAFLPLADGRCSIVWSADETLAAELLRLPDREFCARLTQASQSRLGEISAATTRLSFPLRAQHAEQYVREGFALAGDSAHVIHPLAGQGVNLGLADAEALVRTLCELREKQQALGSLRGLKRYERARRAANLEVLALTDGLYRLFGFKLPFLQRGMSVLNRFVPLKRELARKAMGF